MLHETRLERLSRNKHSSLLGPFGGYGDSEMLWIQSQILQFTLARDINSICEGANIIRPIRNRLKTGCFGCLSSTIIKTFTYMLIGFPGLFSVLLFRAVIVDMS